MSPRREVTDGDRQRAQRHALSLLAADKVDDLIRAMGDLHDPGNLFPGDVLIDLAVDAPTVAARTRDRPIPPAGSARRTSLSTSSSGTPLTRRVGPRSRLWP